MTLEEAVNAFYYEPNETTARALTEITKKYLENDWISYQAASAYLSYTECYLWLKLKVPSRQHIK